MFDFLNFTFIDVIDIVLVAVLIFELFRLIRGTSAMSIFVGILLLYVVWIVVRVLDMKLLSSIMGQVLGVGVIALIIIFQQEIRKFLMHFGNSYKLFGLKKQTAISAEVIEEITAACKRMSESKTGALIVIKHSSSLDNIVQTGDVINADIHRRLIETLFFKNSPLHDGAVILTLNKIIAARCILPITDRKDINPRYGMRHRAAVGISESTDAEVIVVSEETGEVSYIADGRITPVKNNTELRIILLNSFNK